MIWTRLRKCCYGLKWKRHLSIAKTSTQLLEEEKTLQQARIPLKIVHEKASALTQSNITVFGWVTSARSMSNYTFLSISDGSSYNTLQLIATTSEFPHLQNLIIGYSVVANGVLVESDHPGQKVELQVKGFEVLGQCDGEKYPIKARRRHSSEYLRGYPHLRARYPSFASLLRIRHTATSAIHSFFQENGFLHCHTPILSSSDCEATGEQFTVHGPSDEDKDDFFGQKAFLSVSGQLHAESIASCMTSVYSFGPTFRAEKSHTRRHLAEFYMVEAETVCLGSTREGLASLMKLIESLVKSTYQSIMATNPLDVQVFCDSTKNKKAKPMGLNDLTEPFPWMTYSEAIKVLQDSKARFTFEPKWGDDLHSEHEQHLIGHCGGLPLFVTDYPAAVRPFYAKHNDKDDPDRQTVACLDLLVPGAGELVGCSMREDRYEVLKERLGRYLDLRKFGTVPHGGFGLGFERLLQAMLGIDSIRDVIPFPRYSGYCRV